MDIEGERVMKQKNIKMGKKVGREEGEEKGGGASGSKGAHFFVWCDRAGRRALYNVGPDSTRPTTLS